MKHCSIQFLRAFGTALLAIALLSGCASILSKSDYPVTLHSTPEGANVTINDGSGKTVFSGTTPTTVTLKAGEGYFRGKNYTATFEKEGHVPTTIEIRRHIDGWYVGNVLFGGLIGLLVVDPLTGAMWRLSDEIHGNLSVIEASDAAEGLQIYTYDEVSDEMRENLIRIQ